MPTRITEKKRVKIDRACKENPVFVTWINTLGGRESWLFHKYQTEGLQTGNGGTFEPYVEDLENSRGQVKDLTMFAQPQLTCFAVVDNEDINGLMSLFYSINVEILTNPETWESEGAIWQIYRPAEGSFKVIDTDEVRSNIEITFNKPYINNINQ
jgi:hypothetical protein